MKTTGVGMTVAKLKGHDCPVGIRVMFHKKKKREEYDAPHHPVNVWDLKM